MIKVKVLSKDNKHIDEVTVNGHADYEEYGKDIVCSSVSSIVTTTINGIYEIDKDYFEVIDNNGIYITILKKDDVCDKLIKNMLSLLKELEESYPENIKVNDK